MRYGSEFVEQEMSKGPRVKPSQEDRRPGNPGSFEDIHKRVKDLYPQNFEGARLVVKKVLSKHFNASHTITLSSVTPSGYKFAAEYIGSKRIGLDERYPVAMGVLMPNGNLNASFVHALACRLRFKLSAQIADRKCKESSYGLEYRSNDCTAAVTLANPKFTKQQGTLVFHYLQSITSRIALGAEIACFRGSKSSADGETVMCFAFRHSTGASTVSGTLGEAGVHLCYHRQASEQLDLGVEIEMNTRTHRSVATIVYRMKIPYADLSFRGIFNSESTVGGVFEKKLYPIPESSLLISGLLNHRKQQFRVGVGLNVG